MKKARLMLSALGIVAVLGTVFAFTTNKYGVHFVYTGTINSGTCQTQANGTGITNGTNAVAASTASLATGCPNAFTIAITD